MCGRFSLFAPWEDVEGRFDARFEEPYERRYNAAPGQSLPVIRDVASDQITTAEWGLQPEWAETRGDGGFVNARAETAAEKRSFAAAMAGDDGEDESIAGRCLVPADGYYEWVDDDGSRQPYRLRLPDDRLFAMAGLWTRWSPTRRQSGLAEFGASDADEGERGDVPAVETFAVLTTAPNDVAGQVHDRMPAILAPDEEAAWLRAVVGHASAMLDPYDGDLEAYAISHEVNDPANDRPGVLRPQEG